MSCDHHQWSSICQHLREDRPEQRKKDMQKEDAFIKWTKTAFFNCCWPAPLYILNMQATNSNEQSSPIGLLMPQKQGRAAQAQLKTEEASLEKKAEQTLMGTSADFHNKLRKQANQYLRALNHRQASKCPKQVKTFIQILLDLIGGQARPKYGLYNTSNLSYSRHFDSGKMSYGRIKKSDRPKTVMVDMFQPQDQNLAPYFRFLVIDFNNKIEFCRHKITKTSDLAVHLAQSQRAYPNMLLVVPRIEIVKQQTKSYLKLNKMLAGFEQSKLDYAGSRFTDLSIYLRVGSQQGKQGSSYNNFWNNFQRSLDKFYLIRDFFLSNSYKLGDRLNQTSLACIFPFAFNIISIMVQTQGGCFKSQVEQSLPELEQIIRHLSQELPDKKGKNKDGHFPQPLNNAQVCWRCKSRGFIGCSTCSLLQAKTVPLCLDCYGPHHHSASIVPQKEAVKSIVWRWQSIDMQVNQLIQQQQQRNLIALPYVAWVKKQQSE